MTLQELKELCTKDVNSRFVFNDTIVELIERCEKLSEALNIGLNFHSTLMSPCKCICCNEQRKSISLYGSEVPLK